MNIISIPITQHFKFVKLCNQNPIKFADTVENASGKAERMFDDFCTAHRIRFEPIKTEKYKLRPDRLVYVDNVKCVLEIKSLYPNDNELDAITTVNEDRESIYNDEAIDAIKRYTNILSKSNSQLCSYINETEKIPTILLIIDNRPDIVAPYHIHNSVDFILNGIPCVQRDMDNNVNLPEMVYNDNGLSTTNLTHIKYIAFFHDDVMYLYENHHCDSIVPPIKNELPYSWNSMYINFGKSLMQLEYKESELLQEIKKCSPLLSLLG